VSFALLVPGVVGAAVAADVLVRAAGRQDEQRLAVAVEQLAADVGRDAGQLTALQLARLALDDERECALEDDVDLLLALVPVDAAALARPEPQQVQAERAHAELLPQPLEPIIAAGIEPGERHAVFHDGHYRRSVLFKASQLQGIADGTLDLTFRRWDAPRVRAGSRQRTAIGVIEFDAVERVDDLTDEEARRAGWASREAVFKQFARRSGDLYRIELHLAGPDPRAVLRERVPTSEELAAVRARVERMGPWGMDYLHTIAERPGVRAPDLAAGFGMETRAFKLRVRRLKELGLTESLRIGYRLSPRGEAVLRELRH
jgi:hypothetical protein